MKNTLRKTLLSQRKALSDVLVTEWSAAIVKQILDSQILDQASVIMVYMDFRNEVQTQSLIQRLWSMNKTVVIPRVNETTHFLDLYQIDSFEDMVLSSFGILEPDAAHPANISPSEIDVVLAPGVCFDRNGYRMGYGGGFYDKLLPKLRPDATVYALAFEMQLVDEVPTEPHDVQLDGIFTESEFIRIEK